MVPVAELTGLEGQCGAGLGNGALREPLKSTTPLVNISGASVLPLEVTQKHLQKFRAPPQGAGMIPQVPLASAPAFSTHCALSLRGAGSMSQLQQSLSWWEQLPCSRNSWWCSLAGHTQLLYICTSSGSTGSSVCIQATCQPCPRED